MSSEIIDIHTHIYPKSIAKKATENIGKFYDHPFGTEGTADNLINLGKKAGIGTFLIHSIATTKHQVSSINNFIASQVKEHNEFRGFATLHQNMSDSEIADEIQKTISSGLLGIKMHPDFQEFYADDFIMDKIYAQCEGVLPVLLHAGDDRYEYSRPGRIARAAKRFPNLTFIAAHFGGYSRWDELDAYARTPNVFFDTSSSIYHLGAERATQIIRKFGAERFMFGTDFPMWEPKEEIERVLSLRLNNYEFDQIFYANAKRIILGI